MSTNATNSRAYISKQRFVELDDLVSLGRCFGVAGMFEREPCPTVPIYEGDNRLRCLRADQWTVSPVEE